MKTTKFASLLCIVLVMVFTTSVFAEEKPSIKFNLYGKIKLDGAYDQNLTSHGNFAMWVKPQEYGKNDEQFNMTANETRIGVKMSGQGYKELNVGGNIEFDLYAGVGGGTVAQNKAMLQLRHAYVSLQSGGTKLIAGQTWDIISPLNPSTLNYPVLWGCGNTGYRRPQISLWHSFGGQSTTATIATGFFRTIGTDLTPTLTLAAGETSEGSDDGTDAGIPSFQGKLDVTHKFSGGSARFGASGMWGQLKAETNQGSSQTYESWAVVGHLMLSFASGFGISGEVFSGQNMGSYFGGVLNGSTIDGVSTFGGWASAWAKLSPKVKLTSGFGMDNPKSEDIGVGSRSKNTTIFGNIQYTLVSNVVLGVEVSNWETEYKASDSEFNSVSSMRAQTSVILKF
jgi:hypothetical protein